MKALWDWLLVESHRKALGFVTAGIAGLIGAAWTVFVYLNPSPSQSARPSTVQTQTVSSEDARLTDLLVGSWSGGIRRYPNNVTLDVRYTYHPDGTFNWIGEGALFSLMTTGNWSIKDGRVSLQITSSNNDTLAATGARYASKIEELTQNSFTYVDQITGRRVTDRRAR